MAPSLSRGAKRAMYLMLYLYVSLGNLYMAIHSLHYHRAPGPTCSSQTEDAYAENQSVKMHLTNNCWPQSSEQGSGPE